MVSFNFPEWWWRREEDNQIKLSSKVNYTFVVGEGLDKKEKAVSFESWDKPGHYIRQSGYAVSLSAFIDTSQFSKYNL